MEQSEDIKELAGALCEAQKETLFALTDSENPFFKSKYADLSSVWQAAREPLTKNGLSVAQTMGEGENGKVYIVTTLMHISGQWIRGRLGISPVKPDPQSLGSAITYGRRYSLAAICGICPEDDDGEKSMSRDKKNPLPKPQPKKDTEARKPLNLTQGKKIIELSKKSDLTDKETKIVIDWYCGKNGRTYESGNHIINNFQDVLEDYLDSTKTPDDDSIVLPSTTGKEHLDDIPF